MTDIALKETGAMEGVTEALNAAAVERLAIGEPEWLRERREHAWSVYERTPMPTTRLEEWRYTDLRKKLALDALRLSETQTATDDPSADAEASRRLSASMTACRLARASVRAMILATELAR